MHWDPDPARHTLHYNPQRYIKHQCIELTTSSFTNYISFFIMEDDLLLVLLTIIKLVCPGSVSLSCSAFLDWSVLIAAYRLAALISAAVT